MSIEKKFTFSFAANDELKSRVDYEIQIFRQGCRAGMYKFEE